MLSGLYFPFRNFGNVNLQKDVSELAGAVALCSQKDKPSGFQLPGNFPAPHYQCLDIAQGQRDPSQAIKGLVKVDCKDRCLLECPLSITGNVDLCWLFSWGLELPELFSFPHSLPGLLPSHLGGLGLPAEIPKGCLVILLGSWDGQSLPSPM